MNRLMWRMARVAFLFASCGLTLSLLLMYFSWRVWLVAVLVPTILLDLWLERIKPAGTE